MIKLEHTDVNGWMNAIRGMRNPMNSWDKSDSTISFNNTGEYITIGPNDLDLMKRLNKAGTDHSKYLRMINVTVDITAPLYWWKEMDTYKVGTVANSCSTMHKIQAKEFTFDDFSCEHIGSTPDANPQYLSAMSVVIMALNEARDSYLNTKDKAYWWQMIQLLPSSYNQKRTWQANYAVLKNIYFARKHHKLDEWHTFCDFIETLPYAKELILKVEETE